MINKIAAQGNLVVFPKRLVFEEKNRIERINLINTGKDTAVYNVSFVEFRMTEQGGFEAITLPDLGQQFASPYLRVYPRKFALAPNASQTIKVQLINISTLQTGEYRSHLYFRAGTNSKLGQEKNDQPTKALAIEIKTIFGISIPTIVRKGTSNTLITISKLKYEDKSELGCFLDFEINRVGNMSVYGDITINYITSENQWFEVAKVKGIGVYTPGSVRKNKIILKKPKGIDFKRGKLNITYTMNESSEIIAEANLDL